MGHSGERDFIIHDNGTKVMKILQNFNEQSGIQAQKVTGLDEHCGAKDKKATTKRSERTGYQGIVGRTTLPSI